MNEIFDEAKRIIFDLSDALDRLDELLDACVEVGAEDAADLVEEATDAVVEAVGSLEDIYYETELENARR